MGTLKKIILKEKLSFQNIRNKIIYTGDNNKHLKKFYNIRKDLVGSAKSQIKLITAELEEDGSILILFQTKVTPYEDENHNYQQLKYAPETKELNKGNLENNPYKEYMLSLKILDFFDLADELEVLDNLFDKNDLSAIIDLSEDVAFSCSCPSFYYMGGAYWGTQQKASLLPCSIKPQYWNNKDLRGETLVCKHLSSMFRNLSFFVPQIAQSLKRNMKQQGII